MSLSIPALSHWRGFSPRQNLAPNFRRKSAHGRQMFALGIKATGNPNMFGWWGGRVRIKPGAWYEASIQFRATPEIDPSLHMLINLCWGRFPQPAAHEQYFSHFRPLADGWIEAVHRFQCPVDHPEFEWQLHFHFAERGEVWFANPTLKKAAPPADRWITAATTWFKMPLSTTREANLERIERRLEEAGSAKADIVVVPEEITGAGVPAKDACAALLHDAEPVGGPATKMYSRQARRHRMWVMGWIHERDGDDFYNTTIVIDRNGKVAGKFRKMHLWWPELMRGISPGDSWPIFDTDFGRLGVYICFENWLPVVAQILVMKGAELLIYPTAGGLAEVFQARCLDTNAYGICSALNPPSVIVGPNGVKLAEVHRDGIATARLNLRHRPSHPTIKCLHPEMTDSLPASQRLVHFSRSHAAIDELHALTHVPIGELPHEKISHKKK